MGTKLPDIDASCLLQLRSKPAESFNGCPMTFSYHFIVRQCKLENGRNSIFYSTRIDFRLPKPHPTAPAKLSVSDVAFKNTMLQIIKSQDETVFLLVENKVWVIIMPRVFV